MTRGLWITLVDKYYCPYHFSQNSMALELETGVWMASGLWTSGLWTLDPAAETESNITTSAIASLGEPEALTPDQRKPLDNFKSISENRPTSNSTSFNRRLLIQNDGNASDAIVAQGRLPPSRTITITCITPCCCEMET